MSIHHAYDFYDEEYIPEWDAATDDNDISLFEAERTSEQLEYLQATMPRGIFSIFNIEGD